MCAGAGLLAGTARYTLHLKWPTCPEELKSTIGGLYVQRGSCSLTDPRPIPSCTVLDASTIGAGDERQHQSSSELAKGCSIRAEDEVWSGHETKMNVSGTRISVHSVVYFV